MEHHIEQSLRSKSFTESSTLHDATTHHFCLPEETTSTRWNGYMYQQTLNEDDGLALSMQEISHCSTSMGILL